MAEPQLTPEERVDRAMARMVDDYKACSRCAGYHASSFADPPSYHEPDPQIPCAMCEDRHLTHALANVVRAAVAEEREALAAKFEPLIHTAGGQPIANPDAHRAACIECRTRFHIAAAIRARTP